MDPGQHTAVVAGATGLIGRQVVESLQREKSYSKITILTRNSTGITGDKIIEKIIDFNKLDTEMTDVQADDIFCCLGTTMKQAGSKEAFRRVDYEYVIRLAEIFQKKKSRQFLVVSAMGADIRSTIFYNRVKGEMESTLKNIEFPVIHIFRPSLLLGNRKEKRTGEKLAAFFLKNLNFLFIGGLKKYRAIESSIVAKAMVKMALSWGEGIFTYESEMIKKI